MMAAPASTLIPKVLRIARISREARDIKTLSFEYPLDFLPGQFLEVSCFGIGEAPISISSCTSEKFLKITFKNTGIVTGGLFNLREGGSLGIRGPFGNGFPLAQLKGKNLILIAGGLGMAPLSSLLKFILTQEKKKFGDIILLYGSRTPQDLLYKRELEAWGKNIKVLLTVDDGGASWKGRRGVVTRLLDEIRIDPPAAKAVICGPGIMMRFTAAKLLESGLRPADIILSLERHMKCGIGKCGHCYIADKFVCRDGPVFTCKELNELAPAESL